MRRTALAVLAVVFAIAGCGSTSHHRSAHATDCQGVHRVMQCAGQQTAVALPRATPATEFGIDFEGAPSPRQMRADGVRFEISYLSGVPGKDWTRSQLAAAHAAGLQTGFVFERSGQPGGCSQGRSDAQAALDEARALGAPAYTAIPMAVDEDVSGSSVQPYFACAHQVLGSRLGVYGSYRVITYLLSKGLGSCRTDFQTLAWSDGAWSCAAVEQTSIDDRVVGDSSVDFDRSIAANFGQWPAPAVPAGPSKATIARWTRAREASVRVYDRLGCPVLAQRIAWFGSQLRRHPRVLAQRRRRALAASRAAYRKRSCGVFAQRVGYFTSKLAKTR